MKLNFSAVLELIFESEGGYVDHPSDPGGATNMGITRRTLASWRKVSPYTLLPKSAVQNLTKKEAGDIYRAWYWDRVNADLLPAGLDYAVTDYGVNSGPAKAVKDLQRIVGVTMDGVVGNNTLAAVAKWDIEDLINKYCDQRMSFLRSLKTWGVFSKGWTARVQKVRKASLGMAGVNAPRTIDQPVAVPEGKTNWFAVIVKVILALLRGR